MHKRIARETGKITGLDIMPEEGEAAGWALELYKLRIAESLLDLRNTKGQKFDPATSPQKVSAWFDSMIDRVRIGADISIYEEARVVYAALVAGYELCKIATIDEGTRGELCRWTEGGEEVVERLSSTLLQMVSTVVTLEE